MYIDFQTIITAAAVLAALTAVFGTLAKAHRWYLRQEQQSAEIAQLKRESNILCECMSACLDGLGQLGANHTVPAAKKKMDAYLRDAAHGMDSEQT